MTEQRKYRTFTAQQKLEIVLAGLRGDVSVKELCRSHGIDGDALLALGVAVAATPVREAVLGEALSEAAAGKGRAVVGAERQLAGFDRAAPDSSVPPPSACRRSGSPGRPQRSAGRPDRSTAAVPAAAVASSRTGNGFCNTTHDNLRYVKSRFVRTSRARSARAGRVILLAPTYRPCSAIVWISTRSPDCGAWIIRPRPR